MPWLDHKSGLLVRETGLADLSDIGDILMATHEGGSGYYEDDYPWIFHNIARGMSVHGGVENLLDKEDASFEGDTVGNWVAIRSTHSIISTDSWHGLNALKITGTGINPGMRLDITSKTSAGTQYGYFARFKGTPGEDVRFEIYDEKAPSTTVDFPCDGTWQVGYATRTFDAASTSRRLYLYGLGAQGINDPVADAFMVIEGSSLLPFVEDAADAVDAYIPCADIGLSAGQAVSGIIIFQHNWPGDDGVGHYLLDCRDETVANGWALYKSSGNYLYLVDKNSGSVQSVGGAVNSTNMPAGATNIITFSIDTASPPNMRLSLDGVELTSTSGSISRESSMGTNLYVGTDEDGGDHANGTMLPYLFGRCFTDREWTALFRRFKRLGWM